MNKKIEDIVTDEKRPKFKSEGERRIAYFLDKNSIKYLYEPGILVNSAGELIGMNTMIFTESGGSIGLGFAIPSSKLAELYEILRDRGEIDRDFSVGISLETVNRLVAVSLDLPEVSGVVITDVESGSSADKAGLEVTDVIVGLCERNITSTNDIRAIMKSCDLRVGDVLDVEIFRDGKPKTIKMRLEKRKGS